MTQSNYHQVVFREQFSIVETITRVGKHVKYDAKDESHAP